MYILYGLLISIFISLKFKVESRRPTNLVEPIQENEIRFAQGVNRFFQPSSNFFPIYLKVKKKKTSKLKLY